MTIRPSVPEIITVNSETLQTQIRDLLPSQNGFGSELQASNVITPIIDLTAAAEGSGLGVDLQTAIAFGSQTAFAAKNSSVDIANSPGFYRVTGTVTTARSSTDQSGRLDMTDGSTVKAVYNFVVDGGGTAGFLSETIDLIFWLDTGITLTAVSSAEGISVAGSIRQVADSQGLLVNPNGYPI